MKNEFKIYLNKDEKRYLLYYAHINKNRNQRDITDIYDMSKLINMDSEEFEKILKSYKGEFYYCGTISGTVCYFKNHSQIIKVIEILESYEVLNKLTE